MQLCACALRNVAVVGKIPSRVPALAQSPLLYARSLRTAMAESAVVELKDRFRGCLLGLAIGDAVGTTLDGKNRGSFTPITDMVGGGRYRLLPGQVGARPPCSPLPSCYIYVYSHITPIHFCRMVYASNSGQMIPAWLYCWLKVS